MLNDLAKAWIDAFSWMLVSIFQHLGTKRSIIATVITISILVACSISASQIVAWQQKTKIERELRTKQLIEDKVEALAGNVDANGNLARLATTTLPIKDAWGSPLQVAYSKTPLHESVTVSSCGADRRDKTSDDLSVSRRVPKSKREVMKRALDTATGAIKARLKLGS